jgi:glycosyltransferase involved in cell wall biosynthesis
MAARHFVETDTTAADRLPTRRIRALLLPSRPYIPYRKSFVPDHGPDPRAFYQQLAGLGIDLDLLDPTGFPLNPFFGRHPLLQSIDLWRSLKVLLLRRRYDLIISGNDGAAVLLVLLRKWFRFKPPVVVWDLSPASTWRLRAALQDRILPRVDGIMALITVQRPYIAERWGGQVPVTIVGYSVDTQFYRPDAESDAGSYLLSVGDDPGRDYATLLQAVSGLRIEVRIKTKLPLALDPEHHARVHLLNKHLDHREFRSLYAASRFVVVPLQPHTRNASGASTVLEAAAMGKAVIVSDSDGVRDFLVPGETCLMVPAGDARALRDAIERLCQEPETCLRLGMRARQFVQDRFSAAPAAQRFAAAVRQYTRTASGQASSATLSGTEV